MLAGLQSEAFVSGYHADNVAPSLMGGFVLVRSYQPELDLIPLVYPRESELLFVVVSPAFEAPTRKMRAALPTEVWALIEVAVVEVWRLLSSAPHSALLCVWYGIALYCIALHSVVLLCTGASAYVLCFIQGVSFRVTRA